MDSPLSSSLLSVVIVLGAIALVLLISVIGERRHDRRIARAPYVVRPLGALVAPPGSDHPEDGPIARRLLDGTPSTVSAEHLRRIVDPGLPSVAASYPWRSVMRPTVSADPFDGDEAVVWSKAESDGLVALFHLGTDLAALAVELRVEERVLREELARRVDGAMDPVVDRATPRLDRTRPDENLPPSDRDESSARMDVVR